MMKLGLALRAETFLCTLMTFIFLVSFCSVAQAVDLDGVQVPDTFQVGGKTLQLNGYGVRTYSILGIHIYAASLYLEHLSTDPNEIIQSPETKLLSVRFEHSVSADQARNAWHTALETNCIARCHLDPEDVERFLSQVPGMRPGEYFYLEFSQNRATVSANGEQIGVISRRQFANAVLATFLGPHPASPMLRQGLLKGHS
jgi:hypothetical protein